MNNKKKYIYLLLGAVILVWSIVIFKIVKNLRQNTPIPEFSIQNETKKSIDFNYDTIVLKLSYPDPFIKKQNKKKPSYHKSSTELQTFKFNDVKEKIKQPVATSTIVKWPKLNYYGIIYGSHTKIGLISIENKNHIIKEGETINDIRIKKIYQDSIFVTYNDKKKIFIKKNL